MKKIKGISLVEIMIAMALGLIIVLGAVGIMSNNRQNFRVNTGLSELQENTRIAFELLSRDIRGARDSGCGPLLVNTTSLYPTPSSWWQSWAPVVGFDGNSSSFVNEAGTTIFSAVEFGTGVAQRVQGTHAIQIQGTFDGWQFSATNPPVSNIETLTGHNLKNNNLAIICDLANSNASLHQITSGSTTNPMVGITPQTETTRGQIARYLAATWFIGNNGRAIDGGKSLYRARYDQDSGNVVNEEILPGVVDMEIRYHLNDDNDFVDSVDIAESDRVNAIRLNLTMETTQANLSEAPINSTSENVGSDGRLRRSFSYVVAIRNN